MLCCRKMTSFSVVASLLCGGAAFADVTFSFTSGGLGASATFAVSGSNLIVTLTNTGTADVLVPTDVLTGVFFNRAGAALTLGRVSAVVAAGSSLSGTLPGTPTNPPPDGIGGEWSYNTVSGPHGTGYGISSSGLGLFGAGDTFPGLNLQGPPSPDGVQYGLVTAGDNPLTGNGGILGNAFIKNSAVFTLSGLPGDFDLANLSDVWFQYGTDLSEPQFQADTPAPGSLALLAMGAVFAMRGPGGRRVRAAVRS